MDHAIADLPARPIQQAHAAMGSDQPILNGVAARTNVLPSVQVLAVEKLLPLAGITLAGVLIFVSRVAERYQTSVQKNPHSKSFQH
jgi:hypothetical protein